MRKVLVKAVFNIVYWVIGPVVGFVINVIRDIRIKDGDIKIDARTLSMFKRAIDQHSHNVSIAIYKGIDKNIANMSGSKIYIAPNVYIGSGDYGKDGWLILGEYDVEIVFDVNYIDKDNVIRKIKLTSIGTPINAWLTDENGHSHLNHHGGVFSKQDREFIYYLRKNGPQFLYHKGKFYYQNFKNGIPISPFLRVKIIEDEG